MVKPELNQLFKTKPPFFYGYIIVVLIFVIQLLMVGTSMTSGVFFKPLINEFGWSRALISGAFSFSRIIQGLSAILMGGLNDRFGPRVVITISGFLVGTGYLLMSLTGAVWQLYLFYVVILGISMGGVFAPQISTIARWFTQKRNLMTSIVFVGGSLGGLIAPPIANWLISTTSWRLSYVILGSVTLVIIVFCAQFLRRDPYHSGHMPYEKSRKLDEREYKPKSDVKNFSLKEAINTSQFWIVMAMIVCNQFCLTIVAVHIVPHATDLGISPAAAANILSVFSGGLLAGSLVIGINADKIGTKKSLVICFVPIQSVLLLLLPVPKAWLIGLIVFTMACGSGGAVMLVSTIFAELFGMRSHGLILGVSSLMGALGGALGPFVAGYIFDTSGSYQWAFILCGIFVFAGLIMAILIKPINKPVHDILNHS